ncbi:longitudinals lacking protein, isoforms H/M/V isoform X5 [Procambarus clarkii]|uniref:longitudinals lacking protein, isoforms H/M/V isoform X5 n=1 Tax=Procambarus clarkii TaxID=6728 RepID=UPI001E67861D|nr:longitudinals lacking protein, isoforms H/M/V-like isoform X5 [Procambarus clarkii]XP_045584619.1 longitudinals lacking protein, isoforms H/M/V-like isoform X5 [Procambarus clarkii]
MDETNNKWEQATVTSFTNQTRCYLTNMSEQCFCLRWNNYQSSVVGVLRCLLEEGQFVDVTLACDGRRLKAHKLMLSACSNFFRELLKENPSDHPIIFLRDVRFWELESIMDFIYNGQVNVMQDQLPGFIRTAEALQIKGLAAVNNNNNNIHAKPPDPRLYCGDIGRLQDPYLGVGGEIIGELHHPPPLKRPRRPPTTHAFLPPRQENPSPVTRLPHEDSPIKAAIAATASHAAVKPELPISEPSKTDPATGIAAQGTAVTPTPVPQGSSHSGGAASPKDHQPLMITAPSSSQVSLPGSSGMQDAAHMPHEYTKLPGRRERFCALCPRRSRHWCPGCNVGVHEGCWPKLKHYRRPTGRPRPRKIKCTADDD